MGKHYFEINISSINEVSKLLNKQTVVSYTHNRANQLLRLKYCKK